MNKSNKVVELLPMVDSDLSHLDQVFLKDLICEASIGVYKEERLKPQPIIINLVLSVVPLPKGEQPTLENIVDYNVLRKAIEAHLVQGHTDLVETLSENIARICLEHPRVNCAEVSVSKPNAIENAKAAGVVIRRQRLT